MSRASEFETKVYALMILIGSIEKVKKSWSSIRNSDENMPKSKAKIFYAVARGKSGEGVYRTWGECQEQVSGHKGARYKGFATREECEEFIRENRIEDLQVIGSPIRLPVIACQLATEASSEQGKCTTCVIIIFLEI